MSIADSTAEPGIATDAKIATVSDYFALMKPRVMSLVLFTGFAGLVLAPGDIHPLTAFSALLCIALGAGASGALNMAYDSDIDALMQRTALRPIPRGVISRGDAYAFGVVFAVAAVTMMGLFVNLLAAALLAFTIGFYIFLYTMWLKRRTALNIVIGGFAGALPPAIGWASVTGSLDLAPLVLVAIIFLWTPPHFWALSLYRADGSLLMGGVGFLHHLTSSAEACKAIIRRFDANINEGDVYLLNDPFTAALHIALAVLDVGVGDEVIVPTYTFVATAEAVAYTGATPVLADVDPVVGNMRPEDVEKAITPRTRAVIPVHIAGQPCDMDGIREVASRANIEVVEDAAHSLPARVGDRTIGSDGRLTCFSFYATKNLTTGEGGMLTTTDSEVMERARRLSLHGLSRDAWNRYARGGSWYYEVVEAGYKYNMTDMAASLGLGQLHRLDEMHAERTSLAMRYTAVFDEMPAVEVPVVQESTGHAWHLYMLRLNLDRLRCDRAEFLEALTAENIGSSVHFIPLHLHPYFRQNFEYGYNQFPNAERLYHSVMSLPLYPGMTTGDQTDVIEAVRKICQAYAG